MKNFYAYTENNPEQPLYPGYVSINIDEAGDVVVAVRGRPKFVNGTVHEGPMALFTVPKAAWTLLKVVE